MEQVTQTKARRRFHRSIASLAVIVIVISSFVSFMAPISHALVHSQRVAYVTDFGTGIGDSSFLGSSIFTNAINGIPMASGSTYTTGSGSIITFVDVFTNTVDANGVSAFVSFDTVMLYEVCDIQDHPALISALNSYLSSGAGKVVIYDGDKCDGNHGAIPDYSTFLFPFTSTNPGPRGASQALTFVETETPPAVLTRGLTIGEGLGTDAVGDANTFTSNAGGWCAALDGTNVLGTVGIQVGYARTSNGGLAIFDGQDNWDTYGPNSFDKTTFDNILDQPFNPDSLPCGVAVTSIKLGPLTATNYVGGMHSMTATVTNNSVPLVGVTVAFSVQSGPNAGKTGTGVTDSNGNATFTYADTGGVGTDTLVATFIDSHGASHTSNTAVENWVVPELEPLTATDDVGGTHTVVATVTDNNGAPLPGVTVTFSITTGPNAGKTGTGVTDSTGDATFTYTDTGGAGMDTLVATFTDSSGALHTSNTATKTWVYIPSISLTPSSGTTGTSVTVSGTGLVASHTLQLAYDGSASGMPSDCTTDATGTIEPGCSFIVPSSVAGYHTIVVEDTSNVLTATFVVFDAPAILTGWNPYTDPYFGLLSSNHSPNFASPWAAGGNCYGLSSTAILYYLHYGLSSSAYPYFPSQSPTAHHTSDLFLPDCSSSTCILNNVSLAVLVHQVYDQSNQLVSFDFIALDETSQFNQLNASIHSGTPALLMLKETQGSGYHSVVAWGLGKNTNGTYIVAISDPNVYGPTAALFDPTSSSFKYSAAGLDFNLFVTMHPAIMSTWRSFTWNFGLSWLWRNWVEMKLSDSSYWLVVSDKGVIVTAGGGRDYFGTIGNSETFVDGIPGSSGIEEGNMQSYALPGNHASPQVDPAGENSLLILHTQTSSNLTITGYRVNYTSSGAISISPSGEGFKVLTSNSSARLSIGIFYVDNESGYAFKATNLSVQSNQDAMFTVSDWQALNSTSTPSVVLTVTQSAGPNSTQRYELVNGQNGLTSGGGSPVGLIVLVSILFGITVAIALVLAKRKRALKVHPSMEAPSAAKGWRCRNCGTENTTENDYCEKCGTKLQ